jgi:hypothetical protein
VLAVEIGDRPLRFAKSIMEAGYTRGAFVVGTFHGRDGSALWQHGIRKQSNRSVAMVVHAVSSAFKCSHCRQLPGIVLRRKGSPLTAE